MSRFHRTRQVFRRRLPPSGGRSFNNLKAESWLNLSANEVLGDTSTSWGQSVIDFLSRNSVEQINEVVDLKLGERGNYSIRYVLSSSLKNMEYDEISRGIRKFEDDVSDKKSEYIRLMISILVRGPVYTPSRHKMEDALAQVVNHAILKLLSMRRYAQANEVAELGATCIAAVMLMVDEGTI